MKTFCNPLDVFCRFSAAGRGQFEPFRETADPAAVYYHGKYFLFTSKTSGYHWSEDLVTWHYIRCASLPEEGYGPDVWILHDTLYFTTGWYDSEPDGMKGIFRADDPEKGQWTCLGVPEGAEDCPDPKIFADADGRVYLYRGCSAGGPLEGVELDIANMKIKGRWVSFAEVDPLRRGWERPGENNSAREEDNALLLPFWRPRWKDGIYREPQLWNEGAWMTRHNNIYYLQNSAPGTEFNVYADGIFTGPGPLGPFTLQADNPLSLKPAGFITGAGHSGTFEDRHGNFFHTSTMRISVHHPFERRVGIFPAGFFSDGTMFCRTRFGDWPHRVPEKFEEPGTDLFTGWTLQSLHAEIRASSEETGHPACMAVDENIRTFWTARPDDRNPVLTMDLRHPCLVHAVQINFADSRCTQYAFDGPGGAQRFLLEFSEDALCWHTAADRRSNKRDRVHVYLPFEHPLRTRFVRLTIFAVPAGGIAAVSGLRVFGLDGSGAPEKPDPPEVFRSPDDPCVFRVRWKLPEGAYGVNILWGLAPDRMHHCRQELDASETVIRSLHAELPYLVALEAFGRGGVSGQSDAVRI